MDEKKELGLTSDLNDVIENGINHFKTLDEKMEPETPNFARGGGIIMLLAWLEGHYSKQDWDVKKNPPSVWQNADEFRNFYQIRHCFAHFGNGKFFESKKSGIENFLQLLHSGSITETSHENVIKVKPYYEINDDKIILKSHALRRCRAVCFMFLRDFPPDTGSSL